MTPAPAPGRARRRFSQISPAKGFPQNGRAGLTRQACRPRNRCPERVSLPEIGSAHGHDSAVHDERCAPGDHPAVVVKVVADDCKLGLIMAVGVRVLHLARLNQGMQFFLPILEPHADVSRSMGGPEEGVIISKPLPLIEGGDGPIRPVGTLEPDGGVHLSAEGLRGIQEMLDSLFRWLDSTSPGVTSAAA